MMSAPAENQPLRSSWIQRFKPSSRENLDGDLQIPLRNLALDEPSSPAAVPQDNNNELTSRTIPEKPKGFGSFRVKVSGVKFRKPPLPPASRSHKAPDDHRLKAQKTPVDNVHSVDIRLEKLHQLNGGRPRDLLAEFASRLDIREKATPVGVFHVADRKLVKKKSSSSKKEKFPAPGLTPVIAPRGFPFPKSLPQVRDQNQPSSRASFVAGSRSMNFPTLENQSQSTRALSSDCCGSSPFPENLKASDMGTINVVKEPEKAYTLADHEVQEPRGGKRSNGSSDRLVPTNGVKRSRLSGEEKPTSARPWLNRWFARDASEPKLDVPNVFSWRDPGKQPVVEVPSAAAMAIVGVAITQLQSSSHPGVDGQKLHTGLQK